MTEYKVHPLTTGCMSGALDPKKLEGILNDYSQNGWQFVRSIHETVKVMGLFNREAHFLVFKRDTE